MSVAARSEAIAAGLYRHKLPPKGPTLLQSALAAVRTDNGEAFFAQLERETGIDRELFGRLEQIRAVLS